MNKNLFNAAKNALIQLQPGAVKDDLIIAMLEVTKDNLGEINLRYKTERYTSEALRGAGAWMVVDTQDDEAKCPLFETQEQAEIAAKNMNQQTILEQAFDFVADNDLDHPERREQNRLDAARWMMDNGASLVQVRFFLDFAVKN
jgi:hypothetical protein